MNLAGKEYEQTGTGLARKLGLVATTLSGLGVILGAGIYVLVGVAAGQAGNAVWLSFLIAATGAGLTGFSYARLGRLRPKDAPEFQFVSMAFGRSPAFLAGWLVLWAAIVSAATVALGFAGYLNHLAGTPVLPAAIVLLLASSAIVFLGIMESAILAGILTLIEVGGLVFIIVVGLPHLGSVPLLEAPQGMSGVISSASLVFFAFLGFENMANLAEEMKNPERDFPRALILAISISGVFYILVSMSAISVLGWNALSQSSAPLASVAARVMGDRAGQFLTYIALASTANTVLLLLVAASRAMWAMSCAGALPGAFCIIGEKHRTPWRTIILVGVFASLFVFIRNIQSVAEFTNFITLLAFTGVNASAMKLFAGRKYSSPFKHMLVDILLPALGVVASLFLAYNAGWKAAVFGGSLILVGVMVHKIIDLNKKAAQ